MNKIIALCALVFVPSLGFAEIESEVEFRQAALSVLNESLQKGDLNSSNELIEHISKAIPLSTEETRIRLLSLLDTLDAHRRQKSEVWQKLVTEVEKEVGPKMTEKFPSYLSDLSNRCRKMLTVKADYRPQWELEEAAKKTRITSQDGKRILLRSLSPFVENSQAQEPPAQIPRRIGLVVETRNSFEKFYPAPAWSEFFATGDDVGPAKQMVLNISREVLPLLTQKLSESQFITWAVEKPTSLQKADYRLVLEIRSFGLYEGIRSDKGDISTPVVKAAVILQSMVDDGTIFEEPFTIQSHIAHDYQDKKPPDMNILYEEIAQEAYRVLDVFLSTQGR